jgi:hypothetical protein
LDDRPLDLNAAGVAANSARRGHADGAFVGQPALGQPSLGQAGALHVGSPDARSNSAISLNGRDERIDIKNANAFNFDTGEITVECWINPASVHEGMLVGRDDLSGGERCWKSSLFVRNVDGVEKCVVSHEFFGRGGLRVLADPRFVAEVGRWTHVVFSYGRGERRLYVNGLLVDQIAVSGEFLTGPAPVTIGSRHDNVEWYQGGIDEVAIYDRVLDESAVRAHYIAGSGKLPEASESLSPHFQAWRSYAQTLLCRNELMFVD